MLGTTPHGRRSNRGQGRWREASDLLMRAIDAFTEDSDAPDLIEAKALLGTLRS
jgi:hypothetical protein